MMKCASFFAGVGGIDLGFENSGFFEVVYANEIDSYPIVTYEENFDLKVDKRDIHDIDVEEIPDFDVMLAGFPCQAFSIAGNREGFVDKKGRGELFFELVRIFKSKKPRVIFLENVKNLVGHDNGNTFRVILEELKSAGYFVKFAVLNAAEYGDVPQNRERIYIVAFNECCDYEKFNFPFPILRQKKISDIIDFDLKVDEKYYYREGKYKGNIYQELCDAMTDSDSVYQWRRKYVRKNMSNLIPTLTANQGEGGHNVSIVKTFYGIRKMTPRECFSAQGFPTSFKLGDNLSDARLYKQAGNSVCVTVVQRIAECIALATGEVN